MATFDLRSFADRIDCEQVVARDLGHEPRNGRFHCPWHDDRTPDLEVKGNRWKCWAGCGNGDVLDWTQRYHSFDHVYDAARHLGADIPEKRSRTAQERAAGPKAPSVQPAPLRTHREEARPPAWTDPAWQSVVDEIIRDAAACLWSREGRAGLDYLRDRGLRDHQIRHLSLGYVPEWFRTEPLAALDVGKGPREIPVPKGVLIPYCHPDGWFSLDGPAPPGPQWVGANCRILPDGNTKYMTLRGTERGHLYPHPCIEHTQAGWNVLLVEGEFDAMIGDQQAGHLVHVRTVGGATSDAKPTVAEALARCPHWLVATDVDRAGLEAAKVWKARNPEKVRRALLPTGKDLNAFFLADGNVAEWLQDEFARFDWRWPHDPLD